MALARSQLADAAAARAPVIADSYGSYLVMLALLDAPPLGTSVMLLSPVLSKAVIRGTYHRPPGCKSIAVEMEGQIAKPPWQPRLHPVHPEGPSAAYTGATV